MLTAYFLIEGCTSSMDAALLRFRLGFATEVKGAPCASTTKSSAFVAVCLTRPCFLIFEMFCSQLSIISESSQAGSGTAAEEEEDTNAALPGFVVVEDDATGVTVSSSKCHQRARSGSQTSAM